MAIYYLNVQIIGRSAGRSASGAAAYRAGERIADERTGRVFDYTRRQGEIESEIHAPEPAPEWVKDRSRLWNEVERMERRCDAQVAREMVVAFPKELSPDEQRELIRSYVQEQFVSQGMVADVAIHRNLGNPHAHIMLTMRKITPEGFASTKCREWNRPEVLEKWREQWATESNRALERSGHQERIDHLSLAEQGVERLPQVHLGPHSAALERQGIATEKGDHNRVVAEHNNTVVDLEKAREEKRELEIKKAVNDRYHARLEAGWYQNKAEALGNLEYEHGGREWTREDVSRYLEEKRKEVAALQNQIREIDREGDRLREAAKTLDERNGAAAELDRLRSPVSTVKRWFSQEARAELKRVEGRLEWHDRSLQRIGTTSGEELYQQRERWEKDNAKVPAMESKIEKLSPAIEMASHALDGFNRAIQQAIRQRDREAERDRNRGWER